MVPSLATTLDDLDPYNFAVGVRDYQPTRHQPHTPGYPVYIAIAKVSTAIVGAVSAEPAGGPVAGQRVAARGLAWLSALAGALSIVPLFVLFRRFVPGHGEPGGATAAAGSPAVGLPVVAAGAVALTVAAPLFWFTSLRPLSDVPGLAAVVTAQVLVFRARAASSGGPLDAAACIRAWAWAGLVAALAIGLRSQAMWLILPLFGVALLDTLRAAGGRRALAGAALGLAVGGLAWATPLVVESGGLAAYLAALRVQGTEDFSGVDMLYRNPTVVRLAFGLYHTFVLPWVSLPLAAAVVALASVGAVWLGWRRPGALGWLAVAFGPYAVFHLLFHETMTTRYALPLIPPAACLASVGAWVIARRFQPAVVVALAGISLAVVVPAGLAYAAEGSPIERAITEMARRSATYDPRPVLAMHERIDRDSRRAFFWMVERSPFWSTRMPLVPGDEVRQIVSAWTAGERRPIWFLANPLRTDLALIDPAARRLLGDYRWPFDADALAGNTRPGRITWYEMHRPGWFVDRGWALTPELGGADARDGKGPSLGPVEAWVRRRSNAAVLMIGGRDFGGPGDAAGLLHLSIDGRPLRAIRTRIEERRSFLSAVPLAPGTLEGDGDYARLSAFAAAADGSGRPTRVAVEQFDLQDEECVVFGYDRGWHEPEYNPRAGRSWRWTSQHAMLRVHATGERLVLRVSGESPLRYFARAPVVTVRAGRREFRRVSPTSDFSFEVEIPVAALAESDYRVSLTTDATFVPDERDGNGDRRRLGLRLYDVSVTGGR